MSRAFAKALLLAFLLHLGAVVMFVITLPSGDVKGNLAEISFLGTIVGNTLQIQDVPEEPSAPLDDKISFSGSTERSLIEVDIPEANFQEDIIVKKLPDVIDKISLPEPTEEEFPEIVDGPAKNRAVLYQPPLPAYPSWAQAETLDFNIELKFNVASDGRVSYAEPVASSGYPEVDLTAIKYIKNWRFNSLPKGETEEQWGRIKLRFRLE